MLAAEIEPQRDPASGASAAPGLRELLAAGVISPGTRVRPTRDDLPGLGMIQADGTIEVDGESFSPTAASGRVGGYGSGWDYWASETPSGGLKTLATIRREFGQQLEKEEHQSGSLP